MRALAVLLVLLGHSTAHFEPPQWLGWFFRGQGTLGVEIFFVLSGYLIGGIIIKLAANGKLHDTAGLIDFWSRRWARTLPLYVIFLLIYMRFDYLGIKPLNEIFPFFIFMQNFAWPMIPFFQHSWSLAIEEWFYILFPLCFMLFASNERAYRKPMLATCCAFIVFPMLLRMYLARHISSYDDFNNQIRMVVLCRLDAIFFGVLMALIKAEWPRIYTWIRRSGFIGVAGVVAAMFYLACGMPGMVQSYWGKVLFFPMLSLVIAAALPLVESIKTTRFRIIDAFVSYTSKVSYSLYLGHVLVFSAVYAILDTFSLPHPKGTIQTLIGYSVYGLLFYGLATLTYHYVERPFLKLRDEQGKYKVNRPGQ